MNKLLSILCAGVFAVVSTAAMAQDKKAEPKKEEMKPAATAPAKKEEMKPAAPAAKAEAKKETKKKKEKKGGC